MFDEVKENISVTLFLFFMYLVNIKKRTNMWMLSTHVIFLFLNSSTNRREIWKNGEMRERDKERKKGEREKEMGGKGEIEKKKEWEI